MYYRYFGLKEAPFSIAVNPRYLFMSARHRDALAHLIYGVGVGGGFILLTGEVGTGKTTINRCLLQQLPENTDIALILNPALNATELLATACDELGIPYTEGEQSLKALTDKLHQFLLSNHAKGRNTVLLVDEAQHLQFDVLEQIRLLTNLETNTKKLLQIILVGQPELRSLLNKPELRQLAQRITARYQLKPLNLEETNAYIRHRLHVAGLPANQTLFPKSVVRGIHKASRGIPRIINVLCDRMLLGTYGKNKTIVDKVILKQSIIEVMGDEEDMPLQTPAYLPQLAAGLAVIVIAGLLWWQWPTEKSQPLAVVEAVDAPQQEHVNTVEPHAVTTTVNPLSPPQLWHYDRNQALSELGRALDLVDQNAVNPCWKTDAPRCEQFTVSNWQAFQEYNRPAVLTLITKAKMQVYITLLGINQQQAVVIYQGKKSSLPLEKIGELWTGDFTFLWQPAADFNGPISIGDSGPMVHWLATTFAKLDKQSRLLAEKTFTPALAERVKFFQTSHQLHPDGVVGLKTLLKINERLGMATTLASFNSGPVVTAPIQANTVEGG